MDAPLGAGAWGLVYRVSRPGHRGSAALKIVTAREASDLTRIERETRTLSTIKGRRLVRLIDSFRVEDSMALVYEMAPGRSLAEVLQDFEQGGVGEGHRKYLPLQRTLLIFLQVLEGLTSLHEGRVLHRDLKPANIIVSETDQVKLVDFGLSRLFDERTIVTRPGQARGTLMYTSPEILLKQPVGPRSDLYAGGIILFEMLVGRSPFPSRSPAQVATAHLTLPAPPPSTFRAGLPSWWDQIVEKLLRKDPEERYESARTLSADLQTLQAGLVLEPDAR